MTDELKDRQWIAIGEEMPPQYQRVLVSSGQWISIACWDVDSGAVTWYENTLDSKTIPEPPFWMPLPELPKPV